MIHIKIKELAEAKGLNLSQVQRQTGLTMLMVRRYWSNQTGSVELAAIEKLARFFDCSVGDLLQITDEKMPTDEKMSDKFVTDDITWL